MSTPHASFIELLRATTMSEHRTLEGTPLMANLMRKNLSMADYAQVLRMFASFYATLDPLLLGATRQCQGLPEHYIYEARLPYLKRDLAALRNYGCGSLAWQPVSPEDIFLTGQNPSLNVSAKSRRLSDAQTLGLAYVVEGSSQGGKIIAPRLAKQLNLNNDHGLSFFSYFAFQSTAWSALRKMLNELPANGTLRTNNEQIYFQPEQVCRAACTLFQALTALAEKPPGLPTW